MHLSTPPALPATRRVAHGADILPSAFLLSSGLVRARRRDSRSRPARVGIRMSIDRSRCRPLLHAMQPEQAPDNGAENLPPFLEERTAQHAPAAARCCAGPTGSRRCRRAHRRRAGAPARTPWRATRRLLLADPGRIRRRASSPNGWPACRAARAALPVVSRPAPLDFHAWTPISPMRAGHYDIPVPDNTEAILPDALPHSLCRFQPR